MGWGWGADERRGDVGNQPVLGIQQRSSAIDERTMKSQNEMHPNEDSTCVSFYTFMI